MPSKESSDSEAHRAAASRRDARRSDPPYTVVSFHAHPDDEALLTAGTLARACAEGHRVILVCATDGAMGLVSADLATKGDLGSIRRDELRSAAAVLGCVDVRFLGYADSGYKGPGSKQCQAAHKECDRVLPETLAEVFSKVPIGEAAALLAAILVEVRADVLTIYDPAGGYGHPDHIAVHDVGVAAAQLAGTSVVLEATVDRRLLTGMLRVLDTVGLTRLLGVNRTEWDPRRFQDSFADPGRITHCVRVGRYAAVKRSAMAAHGSQATGDSTLRTLAVFAALPLGVFRVVFSKEWFVEQGRSPGRRSLDDIFETVRDYRREQKSRRAAASCRSWTLVGGSATAARGRSLQ